MIAFQRIERDQAAALLADMPGNPKWDTTDGLCEIGEIIGGGHPLLVNDQGRAVAVVVLERIDYAQGCELFIRVARQLVPGIDLTERVLPLIERFYGEGCVAVTMRTRRAGLVAKLEKTGYYETAKIMRKKLK